VSKHSTITPDSFSVAPHLIGLRLASPLRRAAAMAVDGVLVAILVQAGGVFFGLTAVFVLLRASRKGEKTGYLRASARFALRGAAALVLFVLAVRAWQFGEAAITGRDDDAVEAVAAADIVDLGIGFSLAERQADSLTPNDSLQAVIADLRRSADRLDRRADSLSRALEEARAGRGVRTYLAGLFDDLGLGFGWAAMYFTAFLTMMSGRTPGKRLLGVRVIRLDGKPLGWWISFERFGGYAASFSVGLLGFFQILWDHNRQGLHDKACETVVIQDLPGSGSAA
jgi:hypothetical protein